MEKSKRIVDKDMIKYVMQKPCLCCGKVPSVAHHVKTRGAGGGDTLDNLMPLCWMHHGQLHYEGYAKMIDKHIEIAYWLIEHDRTDILMKIGKLE